MQFLYPWFLWALFLLAIPLIIHLFNFRRYKKIIFSDIRFLKQLTEQNKKQQTIKKWLILACRLLALTFLVFAFAQPYKPYKKDAKSYHSRIVSVYVDNSFSMQAVSKEGPLLEQARAKAKMIAEAYSESDQYQLLTNDFEGKHQRLVSRKDFLQMLGEVQVSPVYRSLSEVYSRQSQLNGDDKSTQKNIYWVSDFQDNMADYRRIKMDSTSRLQLVALEAAAVQNTWVDSVWLREPFVKTGPSTELQVLIRTHGDNAVDNQPLVLKVDGIEKGIRNFSCAANDKTLVSMHLSLNDFNWHSLELGITDYPLVYDDVYYAAARAQSNIGVLLLNQSTENTAIGKVYALDSFYRLTTQDIQQVNFSVFGKSSLIILNEPTAISSGLSQELGKFVDEGGVVLLIPSAAPKDATGINRFLNEYAGVELVQYQKQPMKIASLDTRDQLFDKVFSKMPEQAGLPAVNECWQIRVMGNSKAKTVMQLNNDWPYLVHTQRKKGSLFVMAGSLKRETSGITQHAVFVPLMLRMPLLSKGAQPISYTLGEETHFGFDNPANEKLLKLKKGKQEFMLEAYSRDGNWEARLNGQLKEAGVYELGSGNDVWSKVAFNYNRKESMTGTTDVSAMASHLGATGIGEDLAFLGKKINLEENGIPYWRMALVLALAFVIIELLLLRLMK